MFMKEIICLLIILLCEKMKKLNYLTIVVNEDVINDLKVYNAGILNRLLFL